MKKISAVLLCAISIGALIFSSSVFAKPKRPRKPEPPKPPVITKPKAGELPKTGEYEFTGIPCSQKIIRYSWQMHFGTRAARKIRTFKKSTRTKIAPYYKRRQKKTIYPKPRELYKVKPNPFATVFRVYVPKHYDGKTPFGVFFFYRGGLMSNPLIQSWRPFLDKHNLIFVSARNAGNKAQEVTRYMASVNAIDQLRYAGYNLAKDRFYIGGFSGGGKMASRVAYANPEIYCGLFAAGGILPPIKDKIKYLKMGPGCAIPRSALRIAQKRLKIVSMTGEKDEMFPPEYNSAICQSIKKKRFNVTAITIKGINHNIPPAKHYEKYISKFDADGMKNIEKYYKQAKKHIKSKKKGKALLVLAKAIAFSGLKPDSKIHKEISAEYNKLYSEWETGVKKLENLLDPLDYKTAKKQYQKFCRKWAPYSNSYKKNYKNHLMAARKAARKKKK